MEILRHFCVIGTWTNTVWFQALFFRTYSPTKICNATQSQTIYRLLFAVDAHCARCFFCPLRQIIVYVNRFGKSAANKTVTPIRCTYMRIFSNLPPHARVNTHTFFVCLIRCLYSPRCLVSFLLQIWIMQTMQKINMNAASDYSRSVLGCEKRSHKHFHKQCDGETISARKHFFPLTFSVWIFSFSHFSPSKSAFLLSFSLFGVKPLKEQRLCFFTKYPTHCTGNRSHNKPHSHIFFILFISKHHRHLRQTRHLFYFLPSIYAGASWAVPHFTVNWTVHRKRKYI